jgi:hypothetical protein
MNAEIGLKTNLRPGLNGALFIFPWKNKKAGVEDG